MTYIEALTHHQKKEKYIEGCITLAYMVSKETQKRYYFNYGRRIDCYQELSVYFQDLNDKNKEFIYEKYGTQENINLKTRRGYFVYSEAHPYVNADLLIEAFARELEKNQ